MLTTAEHKLVEVAIAFVDALRKQDTSFPKELFDAVDTVCKERDLFNSFTAGRIARPIAPDKFRIEDIREERNAGARDLCNELPGIVREVLRLHLAQSRLALARLDESTWRDDGKHEITELCEALHGADFENWLRSLGQRVAQHARVVDVTGGI